MCGRDGCWCRCERGVGSADFGFRWHLGCWDYMTAGSLAATWQASMGTIGAGSLFASLQSVAMGGFGTTGALTLAGATGSAALGFCKTVDNLCNGCIGDL
eukprot:TRINITY_DN37307_c0_g1_i1.p1 TRINITY_DN37307_c0_g1~~TRINITY_DN37307_c0_g1_i1.p1  ORF type:complete len:100 (-),score=11.00 TRINITY_DN37307_c0_g1_i1:70-369(-)